MNIVFLDSKVIDRGDIDWSRFQPLGELKNYSDSTMEEARKRLADADAVLIDEFPMDREIMEQCGKLKYIGPAATGYNHIDLDCAKERGIAVCNVPAYSTDAVAQHAIALLLSLTNQIGNYDRQLKEGLWTKTSTGSYTPWPLTLLTGRSIGIVGYGNIGRRVGEIAKALGMQVNIYREDPRKAIQSDVVSLHCPLTQENAGMINTEFLDQMKPGAILINTARGGLVDPAAVSQALKEGRLAGYGADVMSPEPPEADDPLLSAPNCILTPHIAFTPVEVRQRVVDLCAENLKSFLDGGNLNRIV